jgi:putative membrane protein
MNLDPRSIPYRAIERVFRFGWPLLFLAASGTPGVGPLGPLAVLAIAIGGVLSLLGWQAAVYRRFSYEVTADTLDIHSGVLSRREREIPLHRIQNVDTSRNVFQRALGIVDVSVETAGGGSTEARLRYLSVEGARQLREDLRRRDSARESGTGTTGEEPDADRAPTELFAIESGELALLGLTAIDLRLLSLATIALPVLVPSLASMAGPDGVPVGPMGALVLAPVSAAAFVLLTGLVSGASMASNYYGFRLLGADGDLRYERGLFRRSEGTIPVDKIQALAIEENVVARSFGYATLAVETAGYTQGQGPSGGSQAAVPLATRERCLSLARSIEPVSMPEFSRPPKRARRRYAIRYGLVIAMLAGLAWAVLWVLDVAVPWYGVLAFLLAVPIVLVAAHVKWANRGYALTEGYVLTRNGFFTRTTTIVPDYRVQTVAETRTVFQRRRSLATVTVDTAGAGGSRVARAVDIDAETAVKLRETVADRLQRALATRRGEGADHTDRRDRIDRTDRSDRTERNGTPGHPLAGDLANTEGSPGAENGESTTTPSGGGDDENGGGDHDTDANDDSGDRSEKSASDVDSEGVGSSESTAGTGVAPSGRDDEGSENPEDSRDTR